MWDDGIAIDARIDATPMGQTHDQKFMPGLLVYIEQGVLKPEVIISHRLKLANAAKGYKLFDQKEDNCRKVVMTP